MSIRCILELPTCLSIMMLSNVDHGINMNIKYFSADHNLTFEKMAFYNKNKPTNKFLFLFFVFFITTQIMQSSKFGRPGGTKAVGIRKMVQNSGKRTTGFGI